MAVRVAQCAPLGMRIVGARGTMLDMRIAPGHGDESEAQAMPGEALLSGMRQIPRHGETPASGLRLD